MSYPVNAGDTRRKEMMKMPTLINRGTLLYTPYLGDQRSLDSNITTTEVNVSYGLEVSHAATPTTFAVGDTVFYTVLLRNTGSGTLYNPFVVVDFVGGELTYVTDSATAFLYAGGDVTALPVTVTQNSPITFTLDTAIPAGGLVYITYSAVVDSATANVIVSTAQGGANEGSETGPTITDSDTATITRTQLTVVKNAPETASIGDTINYQFAITNTSDASIALDGLTDQLPEGFSFTVATLTVDGVSVPLVAGTDYTVSDTGLFTLAPATAIALPAGATAVLTVSGVVTV
ncbi:MAG: hypothetical protein IJF45_04425 [Clostridia bacterium]|nr:hypothetical protein [Clostridia bacterium]